MLTSLNRRCLFLSNQSLLYLQPLILDLIHLSPEQSEKITKPNKFWSEGEKSKKAKLLLFHFSPPSDFHSFVHVKRFNFALLINSLKNHVKQNGGLDGTVCVVYLALVFLPTKFPLSPQALPAFIFLKHSYYCYPVIP